MTTLIPKRALSFFLPVLLWASVAVNATTERSVSTDLIADELGVVWGMTWAAPGKVLFTVREGRAGLLDTDTGLVQWLKGLPAVAADGQGGLLDVVGHASAPGWFYFTFSKPTTDGAATTLARARLKGDALVNWEELIQTRSANGNSHHFGSRIAFDGRGHVFFSVGDRGERDNGQNLLTHAGSILRLNTDGSVPNDNPFVGRADALPEIFSYGHRNPQGLCYDEARSGLWAGEHGPRGGDEVNWILPGRNYGWPVISHGKEYWGPVAVGEGTERDDIEPARKVYVPSIAPGSLVCFRGRDGNPWRGDLFQGALKATHLNRVRVNEQGVVVFEERLLAEAGERIRALLETPEGDLLFSTDSGKILKLSVPEGL